MVAVVLGFVTVVLVDHGSRPTPTVDEVKVALASAESPTRGDSDAKVHIVEFLDPACETCARYRPVVELIVGENPHRVRLSVRHVAFHDGSEFAIRTLEAARQQGKYWEALEALLSTQQYWAPQHRPKPDRILRVASTMDLDRHRLQLDLQAAAVTERIRQDRTAARALRVSATPTFFVNGKELPKLSEAQLRRLVARELSAAY